MKALVLIDIQMDYFSGGKMELVGTAEALGNAKKMLEKFRVEKLPVIHVQHISMQEGAPFFVPDTEGVKIHPDLTPVAGESLVIKHYPSSFFQTNLAEIIEEKGITELVVVGMMTHMCIDTTVRAAKDHGILVTLISDGCATRDLVFEGETIPAAWVQKSFMASLCGTFAQVVKAEEFEG